MVYILLFVWHRQLYHHYVVEFFFGDFWYIQNKLWMDYKDLNFLADNKTFSFESFVERSSKKRKIHPPRHIFECDLICQNIINFLEKSEAVSLIEVACLTKNWGNVNFVLENTYKSYITLGHIMNCGKDQRNRLSKLLYSYGYGVSGNCDNQDNCTGRLIVSHAKVMKSLARINCKLNEFFLKDSSLYNIVTSFKHLKKLDIFLKTTQQGSPGFNQTLSCLKELEILNIHTSSMYKDLTDISDAICSLHNLKKLRLIISSSVLYELDDLYTTAYNLSINVQSSASLIFLPRLSNTLTVLSISSSEVVIYMSLLSRLENLKDLTLEYIQLEDNTCSIEEELSYISTLQKLQKITLINIVTTQTNMSHLCNLPNLEKCSFSSCLGNNPSFSNIPCEILSFSNSANLSPKACIKENNYLKEIEFVCCSIYIEDIVPFWLPDQDIKIDFSSCYMLNTNHAEPNDFVIQQKDGILQVYK